MTAELLASILAMAMSLVFAYVPGLGSWYSQLTGERKAVIMAIGLIIIAGAAFGVACAGLGDLIGLKLTCDGPGAVGLVRVLIAALVSNQATFILAVKPFNK
jgi:hypothetical protein